MFLNVILKEYNINIINLNYLLQENVETVIGNYLFDNNLKLKINSRDLSNIILHFLNEEIIKHLKEDYNNILIFNPEYELKTLHNLYVEEDCKLLLQKLMKKYRLLFILKLNIKKIILGTIVIVLDFQSNLAREDQWRAISSCRFSQSHDYFWAYQYL